LDRPWIVGSIRSKTALRLIEQWAVFHRADLEADWARTKAGQALERIAPLAVYVLGETEAGRRLFCVVIRFPDGKGYPVTTRDMTPSETERYAVWKKP
jgi:hypothetical protein